MQFYLHRLQCLGRVIFLIFIGTASIMHADELSSLIQYVEKIAIVHREEPSNAIPIISIGGSAGVGKTYFSLDLCKRLRERGIRCVVLHLDHFNLSPEERRKLGTEWNPGHLQTNQVHRALSAIAAGCKQIEKPFCNQLTGEIGTEILDLADVDLVLFDGIYSLSTEPPLDFFCYCNAGVFLESEEENITAWKWQREQKKAHSRTPEQFAKHMEEILFDFHQNIISSKRNATFIFHKDSDHQLTITNEAS